MIPAYAPMEDIHELTERLTSACRKEGLKAEQLSVTQIYVCAPMMGDRLAKIVTLTPDSGDWLCWWLDQDEPICEASDIGRAVGIIRSSCSG